MVYGMVYDDVRSVVAMDRLILNVRAFLDPVPSSLSSSSLLLLSLLHPQDILILLACCVWTASHSLTVCVMLDYNNMCEKENKQIMRK